MISAKRMRKYFYRKYSDKAIAKRIVKEIKDNIKYDDIDVKRVGIWYDFLPEGTINILQNKGYIVRRSETNKDRIIVLFREAFIGIPLDNEKSISNGE